MTHRQHCNHGFTIVPDAYSRLVSQNRLRPPPPPPLRSGVVPTLKSSNSPPNPSFHTVPPDPAPNRSYLFIQSRYDSFGLSGSTSTTLNYPLLLNLCHPSSPGRFLVHRASFRQRRGHSGK